MKRNLLSNALLAAGILIILFTAASQAYTAYVQRAMFEDLERGVFNAPAESGEPATGLTPEDPSPEEPQSSQSPASDPGETPSTSGSGDSLGEQPQNTGHVLIGTMEIPKIGVNMVIVEGTEAAQLAVAIGHVPGTALPGQKGNCSVAGHRSGRGAKPFEKLDRLEDGDTVTYTVGRDSYNYVVFKKFVVEAKDIWVLRQNREESVTTIVTCEYVAPGVKKRLIVQARLVSVDQANQ